MSQGILLSLLACILAGLVIGYMLPHPHGGSRRARSLEGGTAALFFGAAFVLGSHRLHAETLDAGVPVVAVVGVLLYLGMLSLHGSLVRRRDPLNSS